MRILFMGTSAFAVPSLTELVKSGKKVVGVVTTPDRPSGRGMEIQGSPVKEAAAKFGLPVFQPAQAKKETFLKTVEELEVDLIALAAFGQILPKELLDVPKYGCVNVHPSLLPRYRGPAPIQWALINGDRETGVTIIFLNERMDAGDIVSQKVVKIDEEESADSLSQRLAALGAGMLDEAIELIKEGTAPRIPQDDDRSTYASPLEKDDGQIDWSLPAPKIHNLVRGLSPWPGTYTSLGNMPIKVVQTSVFAEERSEPEMRKRPGKILARVKKAGWLVSTGEGKLLIHRIQASGKRVMTVDEFCNGHNVEDGVSFKRSTQLEGRMDA